MLIEYFYWQYVTTPRWLVIVITNLQLALVQLFSVKLMLRTLLTPWHRDVMAFHGGTLGELGITIIWNITSRFIGLLVRTVVLLTWLASETIFAILAVAAFFLLLTWPLLVIVGLATGLALLMLS